MRTSLLSILAVSAVLSKAQTHGEGEEGASMGPVAFLWPPDRIWDAAHDNTSPCGSAAGPSNRTIYPLSQGAVALSIADDAWHVAFRLAVSDSKFIHNRHKSVTHTINQIPPPKQILTTRSSTTSLTSILATSATRSTVWRVFLPAPTPRFS